MLAAKLLPLLLLTAGAPAQDGATQDDAAALLGRLDQAADDLLTLDQAGLADQVQRVAREVRQRRAAANGQQDLEDELVRLATALRGHGLDWQAVRLEAQQGRPGEHPAAEHLVLSRAAYVLAKLEPGEPWGKLGYAHAVSSREVGREEKQARVARDLELLHLAQPVLPRALQDQLTQALRWREARIVDGTGARENDSEALVRLFKTAAHRLAAEGRQEESDRLERAARARAESLQRGQERQVSRSARRTRTHAQREQRRAGMDGGANSNGGLREAALRGLAHASQAFGQAGEQQRATSAQGAQRALKRRRFEAPGAPSRAEVTRHLQEGAVYERNQSRANWLRELAGRVERAAPVGPVGPVAHDPLLERLEALEQELSALRAELEKR